VKLHDEVARLGSHALRARRMGIDTYREPVAYMRRDCRVCRAEGFEAQARIRVRGQRRSIIATLNVVASELLALDEIGLSEAGFELLDAAEGETVEVGYPDPLESMSHVRRKVYGGKLGADAFDQIVHDVAAGRYSDVEIASFVTACAGLNLDRSEISALTRAMIAAGETLHWDRRPVLDKHSVGGLPGNRTTPILVSIVAACGLTIPKTSSRAITSAAGTADVMETLAPVDLDVSRMQRVVEREGGCVVWGGSVRLSPADDLLIRVERSLDIDSDGQLVASVLSKKVAAGSTHVVIDVPLGPTAKVRTREAAERLEGHLAAVGAGLGLQVRAIYSDGSQPVGRGIGPALEARDVLAVLRGDAEAPADLRERALALAAALLELAGHANPGQGLAVAQAALQSGRAWQKFQAICEAQGGMRQPPVARQQRPIPTEGSGRVVAIDNRRLARIAKLAGAPSSPAAGLELHVALGAHVERGQPLFTIHAESPGELAYAVDYVELSVEPIRIEWK
jgi:thymidine phosphorylase